MKRFLLSGLSLLFFVTAVSLAQGFPSGIKGGLNLPNITGDDTEGTDPYTGFTAGGYLTLVPLSSIGIQAEIFYVQKGWKESSGKYRINYLELPVLAKFAWAPLANPYFIIGPAFAVRLSTVASIPVDGSTVTGDFDEMIKESDTGFVLGTGLIIAAKYSLEARYTMGLGIADASELKLDMKNSNLSLLLGYRLF